jgi:RND family efflux transporter MFP subunit
MKRRPLSACLLLLTVVVLPGCARIVAAPAQEEEGARAEPVRVRVQKPQPKVVRNATVQPATIHPNFQAHIYARVPGYLQELKVDIGEKVAKGQVLGILDVPELDKRKEKQLAILQKREAEELRAAAEVAVAQATVKASEALLSKARADLSRSVAQLNADQSEYKRISDLVSSRSIAQRMQDEVTQRYESSKAGRYAAEASVLSAQENVSLARAKIQVAQAEQKAATAATSVARKELEELEALLSFATLKAPFAGTVVERHVEPGDLVRDAQSATGKAPPLFAIADLQTVRVRVSVPERDTPYVKVGAKATIDLLALRGRPLVGKVSRLSRMLEGEARSMLVEIDLANDKDVLRSGMYGRATILLEERPRCVVLPITFVHQDETGKSFVYIVDEDSKVAAVTVTPGLDDGQSIEVLDGLSGEEQVIAPTENRLQVGQPVEVLNK